MARVIALYRHPTDAAKFDAYYYAKHVPIAKKIPGLRQYQVSSGPVATPQGPSPYYLVAELEFDSMDAIENALASAEGQATAADLANFATGGVELLIFDTREV